MCAFIFSFNPENLEVMHLAVAACGEDPDRFEETVTLLKAAAVFSKGPLKFHIFADDNFKPQFEKEVTNSCCSTQQSYIFCADKLTTISKSNYFHTILFFQKFYCFQRYLNND